jgi:Fe2+ transport system protein FeoA
MIIITHKPRGLFIMTLDKVLRGQKLEIIKIPDDNIRVQAIRIGLCEGARLICTEKLPAGPIVLQNKMQEIAIGRRLAATIEVKQIG